MPEQPIAEAEENEVEPPDILIPEEAEWVFEHLEPAEQIAEMEELPELGSAGCPKSCHWRK